MKKPASVHVQLTEEESTLIMMLIDSGLVNLNAFQLTLEAVFFDKKTPERQKELIEKCLKVKEEFSKQFMASVDKKKKNHGIILPGQD